MWAARSESADRCVDGKRPSCPVKEPSTCSAAAAAAAAAPAAGWKDGCAQFSLLSLQSDRRKREGPHLMKRSFTSDPFRCLRGKKIKKIRRTAVFAHFRKPGNYLRYSAPLHPFPGIMMLRDRHPPPTITTDQNLIYVQSDHISLHPITATIMQSPLRMTDDCPLNSSLDLHAFIVFHLLLI